MLIGYYKEGGEEVARKSQVLAQSLLVLCRNAQGHGREAVPLRFPMGTPSASD